MWKLIIAGASLIAAALAYGNPASPYAADQHREIKALSAQEMQDYLDGKGMGLAKAAELNHFPGPLHVLELADKLKLTTEQKQRSQKIFAHMQHEAKRAGKALVDKERDLNRLFATGKIDATSLRALLRDIGQLHADVRGIHLQAHLEQKSVLSPAQVAAYDTLRGYTDDNASHQNHAH